MKKQREEPLARVLAQYEMKNQREEPLAEVLLSTVNKGKTHSQKCCSVPTFRTSVAVKHVERPIMNGSTYGKVARQTDQLQEPKSSYQNKSSSQPALHRAAAVS